MLAMLSTISSADASTKEMNVTKDFTNEINVTKDLRDNVGLVTDELNVSRDLADNVGQPLANEVNATSKKVSTIEFKVTKEQIANARKKAIMRVAMELHVSKEQYLQDIYFICNGEASCIREAKRTLEELETLDVDKPSEEEVFMQKHLKKLEK